MGYINTQKLLRIMSISDLSVHAIVIPTAPELLHGGRDWSCHENLYVSILNKAALQPIGDLPSFVWEEHPGSSQCWRIATQGNHTWTLNGYPRFTDTINHGLRTKVWKPWVRRWYIHHIVFSRLNFDHCVDLVFLFLLYWKCVKG